MSKEEIFEKLDQNETDLSQVLQILKDCPAELVLESDFTNFFIQKAKDNIRFMTFSFTNDYIGNALINKQEEGIDIKGVFEKSQNKKYTEFIVLENAKIQVK